MKDAQDYTKILLCGQKIKRKRKADTEHTHMNAHTYTHGCTYMSAHTYIHT